MKPLNLFDQLSRSARLTQKIYTAQQVSDNEKAAAQQEDCSLYELMERAGQSVFEVIKASFPDVGRISVCCGAGNNGGDGFVVARLALQAGMQVFTYVAQQERRVSEDNAKARQKLLKAGGTIKAGFPEKYEETDLIVDALFGNALRSTLRPPYTQVIAQINQSSCPIISVDLPSGLQADTGTIDPVAIQADITVALVANKLASHTGQGKQCSGQLILKDLAVGNAFQSLTEPAGLLVSYTHLPPLSARPLNMHKAQAGKVLTIGGGPGMPGAIRLCSEAALRSGSGLVKVLCCAENRLFVQPSRPELMLADDNQISNHLHWASHVVIGPGLGQSEWAKALFEQTIEQAMRDKKPLVLDADGLSILAEQPRPLAKHCILTPHSGEAAKLLNCSVAEIEQDRLGAAIKIHQQYRCNVVLKGPGSVCVSSQGWHICQQGNPGMASGGMGDVLSGILISLCTLMSPEHALIYGVCLHAMAGDLAAAKHGQRGMLASDLFNPIRQLINHAVPTSLSH